MARCINDVENNNETELPFRYCGFFITNLGASFIIFFGYKITKKNNQKKHQNLLDSPFFLPDKRLL